MVGRRVITESPPNIGVDLETLTGTSVTQDEMYVRCNLPVPATPPSGFDLVVPGREPRFITPERLEQFEKVSMDLVLECAGNGRTLMSPTPEGTPWDLDGVSAIIVDGYRLVDVVGELPEEVVEVVFTGADIGTVEDGSRVAYQFSLTRDLAESPDPLIITHMGGEPLTILHGAPIRLIVPGHYAMKSVKWLTRVEAVSEPFHGYFVEKYRYFGDPVEPEEAPVAEIAVRAVIVSPRDGETVDAGPIEVRGSAWSGSGPVAAVEVSLDGGDTWGAAALEPEEPAGRWSAVAWTFTAEIEVGSLDIVARATDSDGRVQPLEPRWNANGYANNVVHRIKANVTGSSSAPLL